jgi:DnaJ family protein A protein 5
MICHYEVLGLARTATESEIKKAYRKKALELHPDKNINRMDEATREFTIVQEAYEVLSSPQERAWYDRNRDAIIRGRTRDTMDHLSKDDLMPYFSLSCFNGINDNNDGFFSIYRDLFMLIQAQERESIDHEHDAVASNFVYCNDFGNSESSYDYIKDFYDRFMFFSTAKSFFFVDEFNIATIDDRRIRRMAEAKNKKLRDSARKQFNETVCSLAAWIRKRDPRILARQQLQSEKERIRIEKLKTKQEEERLERNKKREAYQEAEWTKVDEPEFIEDEDLEINMYECVVCNKVFKSEKQVSAFD